MKEKVKSILQKINFIETDMEFQKQILFTIPKENEEEMTEVVQKISELKEKIDLLKESINEIDPEEYQKIIQIEKSAADFKKATMDRKLVDVKTLNNDGECSLTLKDGKVHECLVTAKDESGDWVILTIDGKTIEIPGGDVQE